MEFNKDYFNRKILDVAYYTNLAYSHANLKTKQQKITDINFI